jgi:hypothetical protein
MYHASFPIRAQLEKSKLIVGIALKSYTQMKHLPFSWEAKGFSCGEKIRVQSWAIVWVFRGSLVFILLIYVKCWFLIIY